MLKVQNQLVLDQRLRPKSGRKPLHPKNLLADSENEVERNKLKLKPKQERIEISAVGDSNKENRPNYSMQTTMEPLDSSLAEELSAIRKKMERLRLDNERTERMLRERGAVLDLQMKELERRGQIQKEQEIEVDRLYRLKELQSLCMRISPIRTLREKEQERKTTAGQSSGLNYVDLEESLDENTFPSPSSDFEETIPEEDE
ncbi:hypothetical protein SLE2022_341910 [Rubroshorea leprosula]